MATVLKRLSNSAKKYHSLIHRKIVTIKPTVTAMRNRARRTGIQGRNPSGSSSKLGNASTEERKLHSPMMKAVPATAMAASARKPVPKMRRDSAVLKSDDANRNQRTALRSCQVIRRHRLSASGKRSRGGMPLDLGVGTVSLNRSM
jgi:hypothetical protein